MQSQDLQKLIDDSPLYTLMWKWMNEIKPEEAEGNTDGYAFMSTGGKVGPEKNVFNNPLVLTAKGKNYTLGRLCSPCFIKYNHGEYAGCMITRPYYYQYAVEYALLYLDKEDQKRHYIFFSALQQRMMAIHSKAFLSLQNLLDKYELQQEHQKEIEKLKKEINNIIRPIEDPFSKHFTRERLIEYISNRKEGDRTDAKLELIEAMLTQEEYEDFCDAVDERRAAKESRRQSHFYKVPPAPTQINVQGDYVMEKQVGHQINYVEAGATGINVNSNKR